MSVPSTQRRVTAREGNPPVLILLHLESYSRAEVVQWRANTGRPIDAEEKTSATKAVHLWETVMEKKKAQAIEPGPSSFSPLCYDDG